VGSGASRLKARDLYCDAVADLPFELPPPLAARLLAAMDPDDKIPRALEALGPVRGRDVVVFDVPPRGLRVRQLEALGARVRVVGATQADPDPPEGSADVVLGFWTSFRGPLAPDVLRAERLLRPGGRLLVVHDYGRDDVCRLRGEDLPEYTTWGRRRGPFLSNGYKIRVIHCFWTFPSLEEGQAFLAAAFGQRGQEVAATMRRPRLTHNVAIYHRTVGEVDWAPDEGGQGGGADGQGSPADDGPPKGAEAHG
jgi:hypothetical protein